jgi:hypothetical protein
LSLLRLVGPHRPAPTRTATAHSARNRLRGLTARGPAYLLSSRPPQPAAHAPTRTGGLNWPAPHALSLLARATAGPQSRPIPISHRGDEHPAIVDVPARHPAGTGSENHAPPTSTPPSLHDEDSLDKPLVSPRGLPSGASSQRVSGHVNGARCMHMERHSTAPILPSCRRTSWVRLPKAAHMTLDCATCVSVSCARRTSTILGHTRKTASSLSRRCALAHCGGFGTFGRKGCGPLKRLGTRDRCRAVRHHSTPSDSESNLKSTSAAFGNNRPTRIPPAGGRFCLLLFMPPAAGRNRHRPARTHLSGAPWGSGAGNSDHRTSSTPPRLACARTAPPAHRPGG